MKWQRFIGEMHHPHSVFYYQVFRSPEGEILNQFQFKDVDSINISADPDDGGYEKYNEACSIVD